MVKVQYIGNKPVWSLKVGSNNFEIRHWETIDIPARFVATSMMSYKDLKRTFVAEDRKWMAEECPKPIRKSICKFHGYRNWHEAMDAFFGGSESRKASRLMKKVRMPKVEKKLEPKEKVIEEPKEEKPKRMPLPPQLDKLTVPKLKILLEERGLSTEGRKADLIKTLTEAE